MDRLGRTNLHAGRVVAVLAGSAEVVDDVCLHVFKPLDLFIKDPGRHLILFLAGNGAGMAAHALVDIDNDSVARHVFLLHQALFATSALTTSTQTSLQQG